MTGHHVRAGLLPVLALLSACAGQPTIVPEAAAANGGELLWEIRSGGSIMQTLIDKYIQQGYREGEATVAVDRTQIRPAERAGARLITQADS